MRPPEGFGVKNGQFFSLDLNVGLQDRAVYYTKLLD